MPDHPLATRNGIPDELAYLRATYAREMSQGAGSVKIPPLVFPKTAGRGRGGLRRCVTGQSLTGT